MCKYNLWKNIRIINIQAGGTYNKHCCLKGLIASTLSVNFTVGPLLYLTGFV
jgi:hypothetical protein